VDTKVFVELLAACMGGAHGRDLFAFLFWHHDKKNEERFLGAAEAAAAMMPDNGRGGAPSGPHQYHAVPRQLPFCRPQSEQVGPSAL